MHLICPELGRTDVNKRTKYVFDEAYESYKLDAAASDKKEQFCKWTFHQHVEKVDDKAEKLDKQVIASITFKTIISRLAWHSKGDYLATMAHNIQQTS